MNFLSKHGLTDRLDTAAKARTETLARFRARPRADDPAVLARQSARRAVVDARAERAAEREIRRRAEMARAEAAAEAERRAAAERLAAERLAEQERTAVRQAELKAQRDARYLARKAKVLKSR